MKARSDLVWVVAVVILLAAGARALRPDPAPPPPPRTDLTSLNVHAVSEAGAITTWIPFSNVPASTAAWMIRAQFARVPIHVYGDRLLTVEAPADTVRAIGVLARRLDQPLLADSWSAR
jgi:hypothetical protein